MHICVKLVGQNPIIYYTYIFQDSRKCKENVHSQVYKSIPYWFIDYYIVYFTITIWKGRIYNTLIFPGTRGASE